jgi:hypothetical protein
MRNPTKLSGVQNSDHPCYWPPTRQACPLSDFRVRARGCQMPAPLTHSGAAVIKVQDPKTLVEETRASVMNSIITGLFSANHTHVCRSFVFGFGRFHTPTLKRGVLRIDRCQRPVIRLLCV